MCGGSEVIDNSMQDSIDSKTSDDEIAKIKERLIEKGGINFPVIVVKIGIPTERFSDVYGLDDLKDKFFTLVALPLISLTCLKPNQKGVGHFIRALAGEYRLNLVTLDGYLVKWTDLGEKPQNFNDVKNLLVNLQPSILFVRNFTHNKMKDGQLIDCMEEFVFSNFATAVDSVYIVVLCNRDSSFINEKSNKRKLFNFPNLNEETKRKIFKDRLQIFDNEITDELLDSFVKRYSIKKFEKMISVSTFCRDARFFNRHSFTISDGDECKVESKIQSFSDLKKGLKCLSDGLSEPPLTDDDLRGAEKIFSSGGLADVID